MTAEKPEGDVALLTGHTPGPWVRQEYSRLIIAKASGRATSFNSDDVLVAEVAINTRRDEGRHNAELIAAAPELLARIESQATRIATLSEALREIAKCENASAARFRANRALSAVASPAPNEAR